MRTGNKFHFRLLNTFTFLAVIMLTFIFILAARGCGEMKQSPTDRPDVVPDEIQSLDDPVSQSKPPPYEVTPTSSGEDVWFARCGKCHEAEKGLDRYRGEQWEFIIGRMIQKEGAMFTPQLAEKVYRYLYERTKKADDPPFDEVIKGRSHFTSNYDDEAEDNTGSGDGVNENSNASDAEGEDSERGSSETGN